MSANTQPPPPAPANPTVAVDMWVTPNDKRIPCDAKSQAGNAKSIRLARVLAQDGTRHTIKVIGVDAVWDSPNFDPFRVEIFRTVTADNQPTVMGSPLYKPDMPVDPNAFGL